MRLYWRLGILAIALCAVGAESAVGATPTQAVTVPLTAAPAVSRVFADGTDVVIAWYGVKGATGYEVMRAPDPQQPATKVATLSDTSLGYRDKQAGAGPLYYQIVAVGSGGSRMASAWFPFNAPTAGTTAAVASTGMSTHGPIVATTTTGSQASGTTAQCGCTGVQIPPGGGFVVTDATHNVAAGGSALSTLLSSGSATPTPNAAGSQNPASNNNTALGRNALAALSSGDSNTGVGAFALEQLTTGARNVALGSEAGGLLRQGTANIYIGSPGGLSVPNESFVTRIGGTQTKTFIAGIRGVTTGAANAVPVLIDSNGQLGTVSSSRRYKEDISAMADASERLYQLRPVTFRYKTAAEKGDKPIQFGLIAEEVAESFPELAIYGADGQLETVAYHVLPTLLLNELQKEHKEVQRQQADLRQARDLIEAQGQQLIAMKSQLAEVESLRAEVAGLRRLTMQVAALQSPEDAKLEPTASVALSK